MAETDVKCVKLKSDRRNVYRMNKFYGIHCYQHRKRKKSLTCHGEKRGSLDFPVSCRGQDVSCRGMSWACRGRHGEVGMMEFVL